MKRRWMKTVLSLLLLGSLAFSSCTLSGASGSATADSSEAESAALYSEIGFLLAKERLTKENAKAELKSLWDASVTQESHLREEVRKHLAGENFALYRPALEKRIQQLALEIGYGDADPRSALALLDQWIALGEVRWDANLSVGSARFDRLDACYADLTRKTKLSASYWSGLSRGDRVTFGQWEQDGNAQTLAEEIEWSVLAVHEGKVYLMSTKYLDAMAWSSDPASKTWEKSAPRAFLNGEFYQTAFTAEERALIAPTALSNSDEKYCYHPQKQLCAYGTGGADTTDSVYLFSYRDYAHVPLSLIGDAITPVQASATPYAAAKAKTQSPWMRCCDKQPGFGYESADTLAPIAPCITVSIPQA